MNSLRVVIICVTMCCSCCGDKNDTDVTSHVNQELYSKTIDSLQSEIDSLNIKIVLYKDTICEQRKRIEKIRTILEPIIQYDNYE